MRNFKYPNEVEVGMLVLEIRDKNIWLVLRKKEHPWEDELSFDLISLTDGSKGTFCRSS